jgi:hypothetical protein
MDYLRNMQIALPFSHGASFSFVSKHDQKHSLNGAIAGTRGAGADALLLVMMPEYEHVPHGQTDDNE